MQLEIEGETREVDEDKIERLVKYEDAVLNDDVSIGTQNHLTLRDTVVEYLPSFLQRLYPEPKSGIVYEVDVDKPDNPSKVTLHYKYQGSTDTHTYHTSSDEYANLLGYLNLRPHQILDIPGKRVPVDRKFRRQTEISPPKNTATWAKSIFKTTRWCDRLGFLTLKESRSESHYEPTNRAYAWGAVFQFLLFLFSLSLVPKTLVDSVTGLFAILFLISGGCLLVGLGMMGIGIYKTLSESFSNFTQTEAWPL